MIHESNYWQDGKAYHRTAIGARKRKEVFTPEIVYNLLAMAIEKYFMAFFKKNKTMPDNHTFTDLINSADKIKPLDLKLINDLKSLETLQDICPIFEDFHRRDPDEAQLKKLYDVTNRVAGYCKT